jgi:hypothetical protein
MLGGGLDVVARPEGAEPTIPAPDPTEVVHPGGVRRFAWTAVVATVVAGVPNLWVLTSEWTGSFDLFRKISYLSGFYDNQAHAILHGQLSVPTGSLGIEGFVHDGRTYTYFGLLLSFLRIPVIEAAPRLSGQLTAPSMLAAWLLTALFSALLIWRVRLLLRGPAALGWAETVSLGVVMTSILGGSVFLFLSSAPWVYDEDIAWTVPITAATLYVFVGILDRPTGWRVLAAGGLILAGVLERPSPALACIIGAFLIAGWFLLSRQGAEGRRWALPMALAGLIPFVVSSVVNWVKFGKVLNGLPLAEQVWTQVNAHRRVFLASTGGNGYSFHFIPTTLWAYLQPFGLRVQPTFPFLSLPVAPPHVYGGFVVDILYPTASVPATMPLLFLLSAWALWVSFRPGAGRGAKVMRIPLLAGVGATLVDFLLGYIAPRYLGDFLPFLILGAAVGMIDLWRRWDHRRALHRRLVVAGVVVLGVFSVWANIGLALTPTTEWTSAQAENYVTAVKAVSDITGHPLVRQIMHGSVVPYQAPAGELFIADNCAALYLSSGKPVSVDPVLQREHRMWVPVEQGPGINSRVLVTYTSPASAFGRGIPLLSIGHDTVVIRSAGKRSVQFVLDKPFSSSPGKVFTPRPGKTYHLIVETDPYLNRIVVNQGPINVISGVLSGIGPGVPPLILHNQPAPGQRRAPGPMTVARGRLPAQDMSLCRSLLKEL